MNIPSKVRAAIYAIALALVVFMAVAVVLFGWVTQEQVVRIVELATLFFGGVAGLLALVNVTPD